MAAAAAATVESARSRCELILVAGAVLSTIFSTGPKQRHRRPSWWRASCCLDFIQRQSDQLDAQASARDRNALASSHRSQHKPLTKQTMRLFGSAKKPAAATPPTAPAPVKPTSSANSIDELREMIELCETREKHVERQVEAQTLKIQQLSAAGNKKAAMNVLKQKKLLDRELEQLAAKKLKLSEEQMTLKQLRFNSVVHNAEKRAAAAMEQEIKAVGNAEGVEELHDRIADGITDAQQVLEAGAQPLGESAGYDDDALENELEQMCQAGLSTQMQQVNLGSSSNGVVPQPVPSHKPELTKAQKEELEMERELAELTQLKMKMEEPMAMPMMAKAC